MAADHICSGCRGERAAPPRVDLGITATARCPRPGRACTLAVLDLMSLVFEHLLWRPERDNGWVSSQATETVSVLMTDLVGSTAMVGRVGPEAAEELRTEHFGLLRGALERSAGREVKNLGDGLMVVFASAAPSVGVRRLRCSRPSQPPCRVSCHRGVEEGVLRQAGRGRASSG